jgi:DNA-binding NarL/FixJ family response regulator
MVSILIADDHAVVRRGLQEILAEEFDAAEFGNAESAAEALEQVQKQNWDLMVLDIWMRDRSGLEVIKEAKRLRPKLAVLVVSMYPESQYAVRAIRAGAVGYVTKQSAARELVKAVRTVLNGWKYISTSLTERLILELRQGALAPAPHDGLSDREYQVLCGVGAGKTPREIADYLGVSVKTVATYRGRVGEKIGLRTSADFTRYCTENGLAE